MYICKERTKMAEVDRLIKNLSTELTRRGYKIKWCKDLDTKQKFSFNTNVRHEDEMKRDLHLKTVDELITEIQHCGTSQVLMLHAVQEPKYYKFTPETYMLFYDRY